MKCVRFKNIVMDKILYSQVLYKAERRKGDDMADTGTARVAADIEEDEPNNSVFRVNSKTLFVSISKSDPFRHLLSILCDPRCVIKFILLLDIFIHFRKSKHSSIAKTDQIYEGNKRQNELQKELSKMPVPPQITAE